MVKTLQWGMVFPHRDSVQRAVDLLAVLHEDPEPAEVERVLRDHGEADPRLSGADVAELREAALELREVFAAADVREAASVLNRLFAAYARPPRLTDHEDG